MGETNRLPSRQFQFMSLVKSRQEKLFLKSIRIAGNWFPSCYFTYIIHALNLNSNEVIEELQFRFDNYELRYCKSFNVIEQHLAVVDSRNREAMRRERLFGLINHFNFQETKFSLHFFFLGRIGSLCFYLYLAPFASISHISIDACILNWSASSRRFKSFQSAKQNMRKRTLMLSSIII